MSDRTPLLQGGSLFVGMLEVGGNPRRHNREPLGKCSRRNIFPKVAEGAPYLPHPHDGVSDEDEEDDEGFNEGCDGAFAFFKPRQRLRSREHRVRVRGRVRGGVRWF